jgi:hypothetical protein
MAGRVVKNMTNSHKGGSTVLPKIYFIVDKRDPTQAMASARVCSKKLFKKIVVVQNK